MGFKLGQKFRDLFFVTKERTRHVLAPGKQYVMTRQGWIEQVERVTAPEPEEPTDPTDPGTGDGGDTGGDTGGETTNPVPVLPYDENPNVLIALGAKGDLRQTEIIQRNLSTIFSNSVHKGDLYYTPDNFEPTGGVTTALVTQASGFQWMRGDSIETDGVASPSDPEAVYQLSSTNRWSTTVDGSAFVVDIEGLTLLGVWETPGRDSGCYVGFRLRHEGGPMPSTLPAEVPDTFRPKITVGRTQERFLRVEEAALINEMVKEPYYLSLYNEGGIPTGEKLMDFTAPQRLMIPAGTGTILMHADTAPSAAFGLTFKKNGTAFATLTFNPNGSLSGTVPETWLNKGDRFVIESQNIGEPSMTNLAMTMMLKRDV